MNEKRDHSSTTWFPPEATRKTAINPVTSLLVFLCIAAGAASAYWVDIFLAVAFGHRFPRLRKSY